MVESCIVAVVRGWLPEHPAPKVSQVWPVMKSLGDVRGPLAGISYVASLGMCNALFEAKGLHFRWGLEIRWKSVFWFLWSERDSVIVSWCRQMSMTFTRTVTDKSLYFTWVLFIQVSKRQLAAWTFIMDWQIVKRVQLQGTDYKILKDLKKGIHDNCIGDAIHSSCFFHRIPPCSISLELAIAQTSWPGLEWGDGADWVQLGIDWLTWCLRLTAARASCSHRFQSNGHPSHETSMN